MSWTLESKRVPSCENIHIYAEALGDPSLPTVVFIHGMALTSMCFDNLFQPTSPLLQHMYMIRYDIRGHGRSDCPTEPETYESRKLGEDFINVLIAFGVSKAFLAGWSLGGAMAVDVYDYNPSALLGVIYLAGVPYLESESSPFASPLIISLFPRLLVHDDLALSISTAHSFADALVASPAAIPHHVRQAWLGDILTQQPAVRTPFLSRVHDRQPYLEAGGKHLPVLMIHGTEDAGIYGQPVEKVLASYFGERLTVCWMEGIGHTVFLEDQERVEREIISFTQTVTATSNSI